jgi:hypothetical protein
MENKNKRISQRRRRKMRINRDDNIYFLLFIKVIIKKYLDVRIQLLQLKIERFPSNEAAKQCYFINIYRRVLIILRTKSKKQELGG